MVSAWQGFGWTAQLFTSISTLDVLVIVLYFLLVLGIALWVSGAWSGGRGGVNPRPVPDPPLPVTWSPLAPLLSCSCAALCRELSSIPVQPIFQGSPSPSSLPTRPNKQVRWTSAHGLGPTLRVIQSCCCDGRSSDRCPVVATGPCRAGLGIEGFKRGTSA